ncbi:hypothetical protein ACWDG1_33535 [Streptomyces sp. NPDC001177]
MPANFDRLVLFMPMMQSTCHRLLVSALAAGLITQLGGCAGGSAGDGAVPSPAESSDFVPADGSSGVAPPKSGELAVPADADPAMKEMILMENAIVACMRKEGFTYVPRQIAEDPVSTALDGADYALARKYRQKYGFGLYSGLVYPDDPKAPRSKANPSSRAVEDDPVSKLSPAQREAYEAALSGPKKTGGSGGLPEGCKGKARRQVQGPDKNAADREKEAEATDEALRQAKQALNGDSQLVRLAQSYAACLRDEGITVTRTQPVDIGGAVESDLTAQWMDATKADMDSHSAIPLLAKEVEAALKDLECGKKFRAAYFPKLKQVSGQGR